MTNAKKILEDVRHWECYNCLMIYHSKEEAEECCSSENAPKEKQE